MKFIIPNQLKVGSVDYVVKQVEHCGNCDDFGFWKPQGIIEIANQSGGYEVSESKKSRHFCTN